MIKFINNTNMKKNILLFLKKYWILISVLSFFTIYILPPCFQNNESLSLVYAEHVDTGSILESILLMGDKTLPNSFYNQNIPYHTGYYGYVFNSIVFWVFYLINSFFKPYIVNNFYIFPLTAKLLNFLFASLSIVFLYKLSNKILKKNLSKILFFSLFLIFPEFLHYVFHIKPDILGLLFSIVSLNFLFDFLQNPKNIKDIIKANIFGGLSVLCKQPHIFIIFPLFIGFIFTIKGNLKDKIITFLKIYFYSGIIFLLLFFLIHPYAFIEPKVFLSKQISMTGMTSASLTENIEFWISSYIRYPLLSITALTPIFFLTLNLFKKFRNKKTYFLSLISIYLVTYLSWLSLKVGPMRFIAYLIPVLPFSIFIFSYIFDFCFNQLLTHKNKLIKLFYLATTTFIIFYSIKCYRFYVFYKGFTTSFTTINAIQSAYTMKESITYKTTKIFESDLNKNESINKNIIYSISLPINNKLYKKTTNTWQVTNEESIKNFSPNYLFIDFTVYWEKKYSYWKDIAQKNGLKNEIIFIKNNEKEENIILFY